MTGAHTTDFVKLVDNGSMTSSILPAPVFSNKENTHAKAMKRAVAPSRSVQAHVAGMIFVEHLQQGILETKILSKFAKFGP